ncbi:MAG: type I DNA topoisomerase [Planctomycetaceae bacterium]|nr:type I DNA topoisomerase [Planctomycetaceae bacterium]
MAKKKFKGLVIVESPAKARKINSYLGSDYKVLASMGHVRDLPARAADIPLDVKKESWASLGVNVEAGFEPLYVIPKEKKKIISELKAALKDADELILATDEDREGESIGWHLAEILQPKVPVKRMVFSEITKDAIKLAIQSPRELDKNLVSAQETRRILDRLYGYRLSPLLWKKVAPKLSAGRVQSVAVRLIVMRELERRAFRTGTYWDLKAALTTAAAAGFEAQLVTVGGKRIATGKDFDESTGKLKAGADVLLLGGETAGTLRAELQQAQWKVSNLEERQQVRNPSPPFTTSTLQQEANRKLGMSARETMQVAQRLYEDGTITYMRTDSVSLSEEAIGAARSGIEQRYGRDYLSPDVRRFQTKSKGAQEAHEAIRPAGTEMKTGEELSLSGREMQLYSLIWKRTMATQMAEARLRFQTVTIAVGNAEFRATGRHVEFPGFFRAYVEGVDDPDAALDDQEAALPPMQVGDTLTCRELETVSHETQPPARFTEATLIRTLEADGIGRPSTYASIISTIQDRGYVVKAGNQLRPTFTAMAVTKLLEQNFAQLVDEQFTAGMEQTLDDIAAGQAQSTPYLKQFYLGKDGLDEQVKSHEANIDPRQACTIELEGLTSKVRVGKFGPYLVKEHNGESITASLPDDIGPAEITDEIADRLLEAKQKGPESLGMHPDAGVPVYSMVGRFGPYLQLGEAVPDGDKPKRVSIPRNIDPAHITFDQALALLSLPRTLGEHPELGKPVKAGIGRFGPYVLHEGKFKSIPKDQDLFTIDLAAAVELLKQARTRAAATPLRELGVHPEDNQPVQVFSGKYGPYVKHGKINATLPKETPVAEVTLAQALTLIDERAARGGGKTRPSRKTAPKATPKAAAKKTAPKKPPAKKAPTKKETPKKPPAKKTDKEKPS